MVCRLYSGVAGFGPGFAILGFGVVTARGCLLGFDAVVGRMHLWLCGFMI